MRSHVESKARRSRPLGLWVLLFVLTWSFAYGGLLLSNIKDHPNFAFLEGFGAGRVYMLFVATCTALDLVCAWTIVRPQPLGYPLLLIDIGLSWTVTAVLAVLVWMHPTEFGESVRVTLDPESARAANDAFVMRSYVAQAGVATVVSGLLAYLAFRHRRHFLEPPAQPAGERE